VIRKPRVVTFRMDQATWDWMRRLVPYTRYRTTSSFIREGIDLMLSGRTSSRRGGRQVGRGGGDGSCTAATFGRRCPSGLAVRPLVPVRSTVTGMRTHYDSVHADPTPTPTVGP